MMHRWQSVALIATATLALLALPALAQKSQPHGLKPNSSSSSDSSAAVTPATPAGYNSAYLGPDSNGPAANIRIKVPDNARIWFENVETKQGGTEREFVSPPLTPGLNYTYHIRAQWTENGQTVTRTREFPVRAGSSVALDLVANR